MDSLQVWNKLIKDSFSCSVHPFWKQSVMFYDSSPHWYEEGRPVNVIFLHLRGDYHRASCPRKWRERKWNGAKKRIQARACNRQEMNRETSVVNKPIIILKVIVSTTCWDAQSDATRNKQETRKQAGEPQSLNRSIGLHFVLQRWFRFLSQQNISTFYIKLNFNVCTVSVSCWCFERSFSCFVPLWMYIALHKILETLPNRSHNHIFISVCIKTQKNSINILWNRSCRINAGCFDRAVFCWQKPDVCAVFLCSFWECDVSFCVSAVVFWSLEMEEWC